MLNDPSPDYKSLVSNLICESPNGYIVEQLISMYPTPKDLLDASVSELTSLKGIGKVKARQIVSALKIGHIISLTSEPINKIKTPMDIYKLMVPTFTNLNKEHFVCLFLNTKNMVLGWETISIGSLNSCIVHPREVFRPAIKRSSASIVCVHNRPSGNPEPSEEDVSITKRLQEAGMTIGIDVLDHVIIGHQSYVSLKERGLM
ncbi:RadC family protein [Paenibacillus sp. FSL L8-0494]|uniref:RadC family protein n=1 Tax=Paenibacillus sp. FSL L8-0494 TaxID=2975352 RepID=UPI0030F820FD